MTRGYLRLLPGLRDSASMIGAKSVPALASTYSTPRSARRQRKASAVMRAAVSVTGFPRLVVNGRFGLAPLYHAAAGIRLVRPSVGASPIVKRAIMAIGTNDVAGRPVKSQAIPLRIGTITAQE